MISNELHPTNVQGVYRTSDARFYAGLIKEEFRNYPEEQWALHDQSVATLRPVSRHESLEECMKSIPALRAE